MNSFARVALASLAASICIAPLRTCLAEKRLAGMVVAGSVCDLQPKVREGDECIALAAPVGGMLRLRNGEETINVPVDGDGTFEKRLPEGRYRLRIVRARQGSKRLKASELALSSRSIAVGGREEPVLLLVRHRSRPSENTPGIGY